MCLAKTLIIEDAKALSSIENRITRNYADIKKNDKDNHKRRDKQMRFALKRINKAKQTIIDMANHCVEVHCKQCDYEFCLRCESGVCPRCNTQYIF